MSRMPSDLLLVGTTKGGFVLRFGPDSCPDSGPDGWTVSGPFCDGWPVNHMIGALETGHLWAAGGSDWTGAGVWRSVDGGASWALAKLSDGQMDSFARQDADFAAFVGYVDQGPAPFSGQLTSIWSLAVAGGRLLAGGNPATLYGSDDGGASWAELPGLTAHPSRECWQPGAAGLVRHSIQSDPGNPARLWVGISAAGVFASDDGGITWERRNRVSNEGSEQGSSACHDHPPAPRHPAAGKGHETGHCVHNIARAPGAVGDVMWQQNHHGVYRSADGGRSWTDRSAGLPSRFGFPVAVHPRDPDTAWVVPLNGDIEGRYPPDASAAVWKTTDAGLTWARKGEGLPQRACFFTVLRQGLAVSDRAGPDGAVLAFGTNTGSVFLSRDDGDTWDEIARHLPAVLSVEFATRGSAGG
jgi:photosystem II stability/assembly factor-like uncharacterized protein